MATLLGFPGGSDSKESACSVRELGSIPGFGRSLGRGHGNPFQYSCLENSHGQRSLAGYSTWGHKESMGLKWLSTHPVLSHPESPQGALLGWLQWLRAWEWAAFLSSSWVSSGLTLGAVVVADGLTATASFACWYGRLHFSVRASAAIS